MEIILNFLVDNYLWFLIISLILVFGLIGYIVDTHEKKTPKLHFGDNEDLNADIKDESKSLKELIEENGKEEAVNIELNSDITEEDNTVLEVTEESNETELPEE